MLKSCIDEMKTLVVFHSLNAAVLLYMEGVTSGGGDILRSHEHTTY